MSCSQKREAGLSTVASNLEMPGQSLGKLSWLSAVSMGPITFSAVGATVGMAAAAKCAPIQINPEAASLHCAYPHAHCAPLAFRAMRCSSAVARVTHSNTHDTR